MFCYWICMKVYESCMRFCERGSVIWELLREVMWELYKSSWERRWSKYSLNPERPRPNKTRWDMTKPNGKTDMTRPDWPHLKIEYLRLGFTFSKPSLKDSSFDAIDVASTWHLHGTWVSKTQVPHVLHVEFCQLRLYKPSLKGSIYKSKIVSLRLEMLINNIVSDPGLLTI